LNVTALAKPVTVWSDDKTYSVEVRCPPGLERLWYVKALHEVLTLEEQTLVTTIVKALDLNTDSAALFTNTKCEKVLKH